MQKKRIAVRARNRLQGDCRLQTSVIFFLSLPVARLILAKCIAALKFTRWVFFLCLPSRRVSAIWSTAVHLRKECSSLGWRVAVALEGTTVGFTTLLSLILGGWNLCVLEWDWENIWNAIHLNMQRLMWRMLPPHRDRQISRLGPAVEKKKKKLALRLWQTL